MGADLAERHLAIWNAASFDRPKRALLKAALITATADEQAKYPKMVSDISWILDRTNDLEDLRNDGVHAPLVVLGDTRNAASPSRFLGLTGAFVMPALALRNIRANKLHKKDLLKEFRYCRDATLVLRDFVVRIDTALSRSGPWPNRPSLPNRGQKKAPQVRHRRPRS
jgi:hypothetical protein